MRLSGSISVLRQAMSLRFFAGIAVFCAGAMLAMADTPVFITNQGFETMTQPGNTSVFATTVVPNFFTNGMGINGAAQLGGQDGSSLTFNNGDVWTRTNGTWRDQTTAVKTAVDTPGWTQPSFAFGVQTAAEQGMLGAYVNNLGQGPLQAYSSQLGVGQAGVQITADNYYTLSIDARAYNGGIAAGGVVLSLIGNSINAADGAFTGGATTLPGTGVNGFTSGATVPGTNFTTYSLTYSPAQLAPFVGDYLYIGSGATADQGAPFRQTFYDNVQLTSQPVPEPSSFVLAAAGVLLLAVRNKRQR